MTRRPNTETPAASRPANSLGHANMAFVPLTDSLRGNSELMTQLSLIVARAGQSLAARQAAVINEAMDDLNALMRQAMPNPNDPSAPARAYAAFVESVFRRGVAQLSFSVESVAELSTSALELARRRYVTEPGAAPNPPSAELGPIKK